MEIEKCLHAWLSTDLKQEIKEIFEPRYKRALKEDELIEIALNLTGAMETLFKFKWKNIYEKTNR